MKKLCLILFLLLVIPTFVLGQDARLAPQPKFTALDANGDPYSGGKLYTYETGTTTPKTTWTDSTKGTPNTNPVILDTRGQANVWIDSSSGAYRFRLLDSDDVTIWTVDNISTVEVSTYIEDSDGDTKIQTEESADEDIIRFDIGGTEQVTIQDGKIEPTTDSDVDLGSSSKLYKTVYTDSLKIGTLDGGALGDFVSDTDGTPTVSDTEFDVYTNIGLIWEEVGPTGSGATNIWTALDDVPSSADWIEIRINLYSTDAANDSTTAYIYARDDGSSAGANIDSIISGCTDAVTGGGSMCRSITTHKIPVTSGVFELYYNAGTGSGSCYIWLLGWGFNP